MVELILHIGMGKTGTTSIQNALQRNVAELAKQKTEYLGMWFTALDERFQGLEGQKLFFRLPADELKAYADRFADFLSTRAERTGNKRFILSNESLYENASVLIPFFSQLRQSVSMRIVAYVRDPADWLPSAYNQWMIYHKTNVGPIVPYREAARRLVVIYNNITIWSREYSGTFSLRLFDKSLNVVEDFGRISGVELDSAVQRQQERIDINESILRAVYNGRKPAETLPNIFNRAIGQVDLTQAPRLERIIKTSFCYDETAHVIEEQRETFEYIRDVHGIDFMNHDRKSSEASPDLATIRERALEQLLLLVLDQADRITALEASLQRLAGSGSGSGS